MNYQQMDWPSIDFVRQNLFHRLIEPLQKLQQSLQNRSELNATQIQQHQQVLQALLNTLEAWSVLVQYKQNAEQTFAKQRFESQQIPLWLKTYLERHTTLRVEFDVPIVVHVETFLEGILLLYQAVRQVSSTVHLQINNAILPKYGVYVRLVFAEPDFPMGTMGELVAHLGEHAVTLAAAQDMLALNGGQIRLQNNKKTGQQALSIFIAAQEEETDPVPKKLSTGLMMVESAEQATKTFSW